MVYFLFVFFLQTTVANCLAFEKERSGEQGELEIILGNFEWDKSHDETVVRKVIIAITFPCTHTTFFRRWNVKTTPITLERCRLNVKTTSITLERCRLSVKTTSITLERCRLNVYTTFLTLERCRLNVYTTFLTLERCRLKDKIPTCAYLLVVFSNSNHKLQ